MWAHLTWVKVAAMPQVEMPFQYQLLQPVSESPGGLIKIEFYTYVPPEILTHKVWSREGEFAFLASS